MFFSSFIVTLVFPRRTPPLSMCLCVVGWLFLDEVHSSSCSPPLPLTLFLYLTVRRITLCGTWVTFLGVFFFVFVFVLFRPIHDFLTSYRTIASKYHCLVFATKHLSYSSHIRSYTHTRLFLPFSLLFLLLLTSLALLYDSRPIHDSLVFFFIHVHPFLILFYFS